MKRIFPRFCWLFPSIPSLLHQLQPGQLAGCWLWMEMILPVNPEDGEQWFRYSTYAIHVKSLYLNVSLNSDLFYLPWVWGSKVPSLRVITSTARTAKGIFLQPWGHFLLRLPNSNGNNRHDRNSCTVLVTFFSLQKSLRTKIKKKTCERIHLVISLLKILPWPVLQLGRKPRSNRCLGRKKTQPSRCYHSGQFSQYDEHTHRCCLGGQSWPHVVHLGCPDRGLLRRLPQE